MKKFSTIIVDPPWTFSDKLKQSDVARGADANYNTMTISEIKSIPVKDISDPDGAILALWVPSSLLKEGLDVMECWGFKHKQTYIWVKTKKDSFSLLKTSIKNILKITQDSSFKESIANSINNFSITDILSFGMGHLFRQTHEICLIGINNNKIYKKISNKSQRSVCFNENFRHSEKPNHLHYSLEQMFPDSNKLELFARRYKEGWTCLGNEVCNGEDINVSIKKILDSN